MTTRGKLYGWLLLGLLGGMLGQGCGSSSTRPPLKGSRTAGTGGKDMGSMTVEPQGGLGGNGGLSPYDVLCGIVDEGCIPDEATNDVCKPSIGGGQSQLPGAGRSSAGVGGGGTAGHAGESLGGAGAGAAAGEPAEAGHGGATPGGEGGESASPAGAAGVPTDNGGNDSGSGEGGGSPGPSTGGLSSQSGTGGVASGPAGTAATAGTTGAPVSTLSLTSCQVTEDTKHKARPKAVCLPEGNGQDGDPCFSGSDCRAGLACVGEGPGQCRQYCCSGTASCRARTHCSAEQLVLPSSSAKLEVPVCMPVVNCSLAEPPCEAGATCSCPVGSACVVVGSDQTTSCVKTSTLPPPGLGEDGMPCPCGWGFVCSQATHACVKLCQVAAPALNCGGARCQPSSALPDGWGTCVGVPPKGTP